MTIEISELIVRATVESSPTTVDEAKYSPLELNKLKQEILESCRELIEAQLELNRER